MRGAADAQTCQLAQWSPADLRRLHDELQCMSMNIAVNREKLDSLYNNTLRQYQSHHRDAHSRTAPSTAHSTQKVPDPILCVQNPAARSYWTDTIYPYVRYPTADDYNERLMQMAEEGEDIDCPMEVTRPGVEPYQAAQKAVQAIYSDTAFTEEAEMEKTVRERLEECGIVSEVELSRITQTTRQDDEISVQLRRLNRQIIEKRHFINQCRQRMTDYYKENKGKADIFDELVREEKTYKTH